LSGKEIEAETIIPAVVTPPEIETLYSRLDGVDEQVEFVLGEVAQKEGLRIGGHLGFTYGMLVGVIILILLKFVLKML